MYTLDDTINMFGFLDTREGDGRRVCGWPVSHALCLARKQRLHMRLVALRGCTWVAADVSLNAHGPLSVPPAKADQEKTLAGWSRSDVDAADTLERDYAALYREAARGSSGGRVLRARAACVRGYSCENDGPFSGIICAMTSNVLCSLRFLVATLGRPGFRGILGDCSWLPERGSTGCFSRDEVGGRRLLGTVHQVLAGLAM